MNDKNLVRMDDIATDDSAGKIRVLQAYEPSKMEIHTKKVLEDMREISAVCNTTGHRWLLWALLSDLVALAADIERETDSQCERINRSNSSNRKEADT